VGEHVDCELHGEDRGEELVEQLEGDSGGGGRAVAVVEGVGDLRLGSIYGKVL
jgi:hypothetical protein